jgi:hypothetical protein
MPSPQASRLQPAVENRFVAGVEETAKFFMSTANVQLALDRLVERLGRLRIPYAIVGAMALNAYGYRRATGDVGPLVRRDGLEAFKQAYLGWGYVEKFPGSKGLRDTVHNVQIDVLVAGDFPGDGKEKPIAFPDPATAGETGERFSLLPLTGVSLHPYVREKYLELWRAAQSGDDE